MGMKVDLYNFQDKISQNNIAIKTPWETNEWLRVMRIIIHNEKGQVLLTQNALNAECFANKWDIGIMGLVQSAENLLDAASRICNEKLSIYMQASNLKFLYRYSEICVQNGQALKMHTQVAGCQVTGNKVHTDYIDYNILQSLSWEDIGTLRDKILGKPELYAYHSCHSLQTSQRIAYWGKMMEIAKSHIDAATSFTLLQDLQKLSRD
ncbi:MAG: NUDIX domain-containing protein [Spirochaetota bacterium]